MNDLPDVELVTDNLMKFDRSREETMITLEKEPAADLLEDLYHRQLVDSHAKCLGAILFRSSSPHGAEELLEVQGYGLRLFEDLQQNFLLTQEDKGQVEDRSIPVAVTKQRRRETTRLHSVVIERLVLKGRKMCVQAR